MWPWSGGPAVEAGDLLARNMSSSLRVLHPRLQHTAALMLSAILALAEGQTSSSASDDSFFDGLGIGLGVGMPLLAIILGCGLPFLMLCIAKCHEKIHSDRRARPLPGNSRLIVPHHIISEALSSQVTPPTELLPSQPHPPTPPPSEPCPPYSQPYPPTPSPSQPYPPVPPSQPYPPPSSQPYPPPSPYPPAPPPSEPYPPFPPPPSQPHPPPPPSQPYPSQPYPPPPPSQPSPPPPSQPSHPPPSPSQPSLNPAQSSSVQTGDNDGVLPPEYSCGDEPPAYNTIY